LLLLFDINSLNNFYVSLLVEIIIQQNYHNYNNNPTMFASSSSHKPPLDLYGLNARYANAAYIAASKSNTLDKVESELLAIKQTAESSPAFKSFLENPLISRSDKTKQVEDMLKSKTTSVTLNLMTTLAGNARLINLPGITDNYVQLMKAKRGEVEATIISAEPLNKSQTEAVATAMKSQFPAGAKVVLKSEVNPSILGGLQIQIGDKFLDLSVGSRIEEVGRTPV
jgi:F-type H+-transporting ATPase subunit O